MSTRAGQLQLQLKLRFAERELKGEVVLLVGPPVAREQLTLDEGAVRERMGALMNEGVSRKAAVRQVAAEMGPPRNDVYRVSLGEDNHLGLGDG